MTGVQTCALPILKQRLSQHVDLTPEEREELIGLRTILNNVLGSEAVSGNQYTAKVLPMMGVGALIIAVAIGCFLHLSDRART